MPTERTAAEIRAVRGRVGSALIIGLAVASLLLAALDLVYERHPHFAIEGWMGFYALCGAVAAALGLGVALLLDRIARRPEDGDDR